MDRSVAGQPLRDRDLTPKEVEQFRLLLSTFCDGSGSTVKGMTGTFPNYLDFERVTAVVCEGKTGEDKGIFDVTVPVPSRLPSGLTTKPYGVSCKMAGPGLASDPDTAFMELSNSAKKFEDDFLGKGYDWVNHPEHAGPACVELVMQWHQEVADQVDLARSCYLVLTHAKKWDAFRLSTYDLNLKHADPTAMEWETRNHRKTGEPNSLVGTWTDPATQKQHRIWEFYPLSGGQLKYYPMRQWATWEGEWFSLEEPPQHNLTTKAKQYFPDLWQD